MRLGTDRCALIRPENVNYQIGAKDNAACLGSGEHQQVRSNVLIFSDCSTTCSAH